MESHLGCYDMIMVWSVFFNSIFTGHLDHCFICLCTRILIKDLIHSNGFTYFFSKQCLRNCVWIVKCMHDVANLIFNCCYNFFITASCVVNCNSCIKIKICFSIFIVHIHVFCSLRKEVKTFICFDHIFVYFIFNVLTC